MLPADYLLAVGFKTVRPHQRYPRLRLELKTAMSWREDVEVALERLLGSMAPERPLNGALHPGRGARHPAPKSRARNGARLVARSRGSEEVGQLLEHRRLGLGPDDLLDDLTAGEDVQVGMFMMPYFCARSGSRPRSA